MAVDEEEAEMREDHDDESQELDDRSEDGMDIDDGKVVEAEDEGLRQGYSRERSILSSVSASTTFSTLPNNSLALPPPTVDWKPKTLHILYVPDPSRACGLLTQMESDLAYADRTIPKTAVDTMMQVIPEFVFIKRTGKPDNTVEILGDVPMKVRILEWVS